MHSSGDDLGIETVITRCRKRLSPRFHRMTGSIFLFLENESAEKTNARHTGKNAIIALRRVLFMAVSEFEIY
jgi:hypothetical protein